MKFKIVISIGLISLGLIFSACDKDDNKPDFRDKFIGKYQVTESIYCYGPCNPCSSERDTIIIVKYGITDSTINVLGRDICLDSTGSFYAYHYGLRFWDDSISSTYMNGGLGCGQYETYRGYRISNTP